MTTVPNKSTQLSNNNLLIFKLHNDKSLELKGINIIARQLDGYINATQLCTAGNKLWKNYFQNAKTKAYLQVLSSSVGLPAGELIRYNTGSNKTRATWVHRKVAIHIAQWISPLFSVQVTNWLDELLITGQVTLGQEKSNKQLEDRYTEEIQNLQLQLTQANEEKFKIQHKYNSRLQKHRFYKFKKIGPCFYIITQGLEYKDGISRIKIGICGCSKRTMTNCPHCNEELHKNIQNESFDHRLQNHRTLWPQLQVKFAVYTEDASLLEKCIKRTYKDAINPGGHEIIENIRLEDVVKETSNFLKLFNVYNEDDEYLIEENIEDYNKITLTAMKEQVTHVVKKVIEEVKEEIKEKDVIIEEVKEEIKEKSNDLAKYQEYINKIEKYKVKDLCGILKEFGLIQKGVKKDQQTRLKAYLENQISKYNADVCKHGDKETLNNLSKYTYNELKKIATKYNLIQRGTCNDLCERIKSYLEQGVIDSVRRKDVYQYDKYGKLVKHWRTITELVNELNICKNFIAGVRDQKCLANGYVWMSKSTVFTVKELHNINKTVKKTRRNLMAKDHLKIKKKYNQEVSKGYRSKSAIL